MEKLAWRSLHRVNRIYQWGKSGGLGRDGPILRNINHSFIHHPFLTLLYITPTPIPSPLIYNIDTNPTNPTITNPPTRLLIPTASLVEFELRRRRRCGPLLRRCYRRRGGRRCDLLRRCFSRRRGRCRLRR